MLCLKSHTFSPLPTHYIGRAGLSGLLDVLTEPQGHFKWHQCCKMNTYKTDVSED